MRLLKAPSVVSYDFLLFEFYKCFCAERYLRLNLLIKIYELKINAEMFC